MTIKTIWPMLAGAALAASLAGAAPAADAMKRPPARKAARKPRPPRPPQPCFLDANNAGPDYDLQGEYAAKAGKQKIGVQVRATGDGKFVAAFLEAGLPGNGYTHDKKRFEVTGQLKGGKCVFDGGPGKYEAVIESGRLIGRTDKGEKIVGQRVVRKSPTLGAKCPAGAIMLFDGTNTDAWKNGKMDKRNLLAAGAETKENLPDCTLHVEFLLPFKPATRGQDRGNSGIYLQHRYEVQVLDSFGLPGRSSECGGFYQKVAPLVNMCYPPLTWQTYDIEFTAAKWKDGKKVEDVSLTVRHNGVLIHENLRLNNKTGSGMRESPEGGPLWLQYHKNPVFFRNIWLVPKK